MTELASAPPAPTSSAASLRRRSRSAVARSAGGERSLAVLIGLLLLAAGVLAALLSFGVLGSARADRPLLDPMIVDWMRANQLAARAIAIGVGLLLTVVGLVLAARSLRPERRPDVQVDGGAGTDIVVAAGAVGDALAEQATTLPGVSKARARMVGTTRSPALRVTLWLADDADVATVLDALDSRILTSARTSLGLSELPVAVRLELHNPAPPPRVR